MRRAKPGLNPTQPCFLISLGGTRDTKTVKLAKGAPKWLSNDLGTSLEYIIYRISDGDGYAFKRKFFGHDDWEEWWHWQDQDGAFWQAPFGEVLPLSLGGERGTAKIGVWYELGSEDYELYEIPLAKVENDGQRNADQASQCRVEEETGQDPDFQVKREPPEPRSSGQTGLQVEEERRSSVSHYVENDGIEAMITPNPTPESSSHQETVCRTLIQASGVQKLKASSQKALNQIHARIRNILGHKASKAAAADEKHLLTPRSSILQEWAKSIFEIRAIF